MHKIIKTPDRTFEIRPDNWLGRSEYFDKIFSGVWADGRADARYFLDIDSNVLSHILDYLRSGVLPLFYDNDKGHDIPLYHAVLREATYLGIDRLCRWIKEKKYQEAVIVHHIAAESWDRSSGGKTTRSDSDGRTLFREDPRFIELSSRGHMSASLVPITQQISRWYCPNGKHTDGDPNYCSSCAQVAASNRNEISGGWRNEEVLKWCVVRKETVVDYELCFNAFTEEDT